MAAEMEKESKRLTDAIIQKNSIGTKLKQSVGALATPEGIFAALLVVGSVSYLGYKIMQARRWTDYQKTLIPL